MTKKVTLTQRWRKWCWGSEGHPAEPFWAMTALANMLIAFLSLIVHLGWKDGMVSGIALVVMCVTGPCATLSSLFGNNGFGFGIGQLV